MKEYNTFEKITENDQAYLIGYLCGDGGVLGKSAKRTTRIQLASTDKDTIFYIVEKFCPDVTISKVYGNNPKRNIYAKTPAYKFTFPAKFEQTFKKFGILDFKENRRLVNISKRNMRAYLIGLWDADGHISWGYRKDRNRLWGKAGVTHQSVKLLESIQRYLDDELGISSGIHSKKGENCYVLEFAKLINVEKFCNFLYGTEYKGYMLERKRQKALQFCHQIGLKRESYVK